MTEKHQAIFKGDVCEKIWVVDSNIQGERSYPFYYYDHKYEIEKIKKIETPEVDFTFYKAQRRFKKKELWSGEISRPVLSVDEEIYINDLDLVVKIDRKYRTTNDEIIYEVSHVIEAVETEDTKRTRLSSVESWMSAFYPDYETFDELKSEFIKKNPVEIVEEIIEELEEPWKPSWEKEEKQEKTWFGWLRNLIDK